jgi:c(7)-type cytochrome triheme protein
VSSIAVRLMPYVRCRTDHPAQAVSNTYEHNRYRSYSAEKCDLPSQATLRGNNMKSPGILTAFFSALMLSTWSVMAVPPGKTVEFASPMGKVIFDGKTHADKGVKCADCHTKPKLFAMKKGNDKVTMVAMNEGKFCGACHDGKKAFSVKVETDCVKCHKTGGAGAKPGAKAPMQTSEANNPDKEKSTKSTAKQESPGEYVDDAVITAKVKAAVLEEPSLKSAEINVETLKGTVQLSGFVRSRADINKAVDVAKGVKGVKSVKNDMVLKGTQ